MFNRSSLAATISSLEEVLVVVGQGYVATAVTDESRESLRERFRRVLRVLQRFQADAAAMQDALSRLPVSHRSARQPDNVFTQKAQPSGDELVRRTLAEFCSSSSLYAEGHHLLPASGPFFSKAPATLDVAIQMSRDGMTAVVVALMDVWSRRHDILKSDAAPEQAPRRRRSLDRLYLALMRFDFGFFGSHKVDARNTP